MPCSSYIHNYSLCIVMLKQGLSRDVCVCVRACACVCVRAHVCGRENAGARHMEFINVLGKLPLPIKNHGFR